MKIKDLNKILPSGYDIENIEVDPTPVIEHRFFEDRSIKDYRRESIQFMINNKINFHTTFNSVHDFVKAFIRVQCPTCHFSIEGMGGGGSGDVYSIRFKCKCGTETTIQTPVDGYHVEFKDGVK